MRAAVMRNKKLVVDTVPDPTPSDGEVLVKTLACGICGSDLHALKFADQMVETARESGAPFSLDVGRDVVMGHEFCCEVVDFGPNNYTTLKAGERVVSMPLIFRNGAMQAVGYSNDVPGGYGELMTLSGAMLLAVPNGLATEYAAMTEPMAVGLHAVNKARLEAHDAPLVIGCGPVGLAVIAALKLKGSEPIVAADYSPKRRALAQKMGAHVVVDPAQQPTFEAYRQAADLRPSVIFECVGVPGMLQQILRQAPLGARIVVAGVCMEPDTIKPALGINKELNIQFVLGYTPDEFAATLRHLSEGAIDVAPLVTGKVGVAEVPQAFETLANPEAHAKIIVEPWR
ncbi:MAG: zinc-binding dehydrogenase [Deltaproteobacteria bacterium]|nr:zinc-binding dehydrogenase [Deltaproteobacteria bacterium]